MVHATLSWRFVAVLYLLPCVCYYYYQLVATSSTGMCSIFFRFFPVRSKFFFLWLLLFVVLYRLTYRLTLMLSDTGRRMDSSGYVYSKHTMDGFPPTKIIHQQNKNNNISLFHTFCTKKCTTVLVPVLVTVPHILILSYQYCTSLFHSTHAIADNSTLHNPTMTLRTIRQKVSGTVPYCSIASKSVTSVTHVTVPVVVNKHIIS